jgi:hypothetical protein
VVDASLAEEFGITTNDVRFLPLRSTARRHWAAVGRDDWFSTLELVQALHWASRGYQDGTEASESATRERLATQEENAPSSTVGAAAPEREEPGSAAIHRPSPWTRTDQSALDSRLRAARELLAGASPAADAATADALRQSYSAFVAAALRLRQAGLARRAGRDALERDLESRQRALERIARWEVAAVAHNNWLAVSAHLGELTSRLGRLRD